MHRGRAGNRGGGGGALTLPDTRVTARGGAIALALLAVLLTACEGNSAELPAVGLEPGLLAPALEGATADGAEYRLSGSGGDRLVLFFRSDRCGLCVLRLQELAQHAAEYRELGVTVVAATPAFTGLATSLSREDGSPVPLVSVDSSVAAAWGMGGGSSTDDSPLLAAHLLDGKGVLRYSRISRHAADRISDAELLTVLEQRRRADAARD